MPESGFVSLLGELMPKPGRLATPIADFFLLRRDSRSPAEKCLDRPLAALIIQGDKKLQAGSQEYVISRDQSMVVAVEMPSVSSIVNASPEQPLLSAFFFLNRGIIADLLAEMEPEQHECGASRSIISVADAEPDFIKAMRRMTELLKKPEQIPILAPLIYRELHYLLLLGRHKNVLKNFYAQNVPNQQIFSATSYLKRHIGASVSIRELAEVTHMSESTLYRHFKAVTGYSPLQYHKELKLHEARRIMRAENIPVTDAAIRVGYESVTQFTREYKRLFGLPPHKDIQRSKYAK